MRSRDQRFAYDVCHPRMMEYLLAHRDLTLEIEQHALALVFPTRLAVAELERNLRRLLTVRALMPDYLFQPA